MTAPPPTRQRGFQWPRIFGYDFFVSFKLGPPPIGTQSYSSDLARRLRELDFTVFFSEEEAPPGQELNTTLVRALRRSRVLVVIVNEGSLVRSVWVRKEVEEFRRLHPRRAVIPIVVDRAIDQFGSSAETTKWLGDAGRIWLDESAQAVVEGIASAAVVQRLQVLHRFTRANTWFRWTVSAIILTLAGLTTFALYEAWDATRKFRDATALRLAAEGQAMTSAERPGGSRRGLLQVLAAPKISRSPGTDEALENEFLKFRRQVAIRDVGHVIDSLAFSRDGRSIVSGSHDGTVQLWDAQSAAPIGQPWLAHGPVSSVGFVPGVARIVTGSRDGVMELWDLATHQPVTPDPAIPSMLFNWTVAVSGDGARFAWGREGGDVGLWNLVEGRAVAAQTDRGGTIETPLALSFSGDGQRIAYYSYAGTVGVLVVDSSSATAPLLWKASLGNEPIGFGPMNDFGVRSGVVAFSPDGGRVVSGSTGGRLQLWDAATGRPLSSPSDAHAAGVTTVAFTPDGRRVISGGNDGTVKIWSADPLNILNRGEASHTGPVTALAVSDDGRRFASAGLDATLRIWDAGENTPLGTVVRSERDEPLAVVFAPDGEPLVSGAHVRNMGGRASDVFATSPDRSRSVLRVGQRELWLADGASGKRIGQLTAEPAPVDSVVFSADGARLVSVAGDDVLVWDARTGRRQVALHADQHGVTSVALDGDLVATGGQDGTVRIWSARAGKPVRQAITAHTAPVLAVAFSPDGRRVVSGSQDRTLKIWDVASGALLVGPMVGHEAGVRSVAFSPDGARIVSGGGIPLTTANQQQRVDYGLRLWDSASGRQIGRALTGHEHDVESVAFSADGNRIVSASLDDTVRVWEVFGAWTDALCRKLSQNPTGSEWREWVTPAIAYQCPCVSVAATLACPAAESEEGKPSLR